MAGRLIDAPLRNDAVFRQLLEAAPDAMVIADALGHIVMMNTQVEKLFGYTLNEVAGKPLEMLVPEFQMRPMRVGVELFARRKDGGLVPVEISLSPLDTDEGQLITSAIRDISERKAAEEARRRLREKEALLSEIHHRVKNNLQVVSSLLNLQGQQITDPEARRMFQASQGRIRSMALVHEQLYQSGDFGGIDFHSYLRVLAADLLGSYRADPNSINVRVTADPIRLSLETSIPCGLIVNELISNSLKHAFAQRSSGEIRIGFRERDAFYSLSVDDNGAPLPADLAQRDSLTMGLRLVRVLTRQLDGELRVGEAGRPKFEIVFPQEAERR